MKTNAFARIWFRRIKDGTAEYTNCPEKVKNYEVKPIVKQMLIDYGYEDLVTD